MESQVNRAANVILVWKKMRKTLPLGNSQKKKKRFKPCYQEEQF
jgi:hypothetical protein